MAETPRAGAASRAGKPNPLEEILYAEPIDIPTVEVVGDFFNNVRFVSSTAMSSMLGFAKLEDGGHSVLIPFVETRIAGGSPSDDADNDGPPLFSGVLTLENAAFLTVNLASDMRSACEELSTLSGSTTQIERSRLMQCRYLLAHTVREALAATSKLTAILDSYPVEQDDNKGAQPPSATPSAVTASDT